MDFIASPIFDILNFQTWKVKMSMYLKVLVMLRFSKYVKTESRQESATYIHEKNTPHIYAKPKVT